LPENKLFEQFLKLHKTDSLQVRVHNPLISFLAKDFIQLKHICKFFLLPFQHKRTPRQIWLASYQRHYKYEKSLSAMKISLLKVTLLLLFNAKITVSQGNQRGFHHHCLYFA